MSLPAGSETSAPATHQALYAINDVASTSVVRVRMVDKFADQLPANTSEGCNAVRAFFDVQIPTTHDTGLVECGCGHA